MGLVSSIEKYKDLTDCRFVLGKIYSDNEEARLEINDLIFELYSSEDFEIFLKTNSDENVWYILDLLSDNDDFKYIIEDLIIFSYEASARDNNNENTYCWDACEGFASERDFWHWKEGV